MSTPFGRTTRALNQDNAKRALSIGLLATLLLAAWLVWFFQGRVTLYEHSVQAHLEARQSAYTVAAPVASRVLISHLTLGQEVQAGDVLLELDNTDARSRWHEEAAQLAAMSPRMQALKQELASQEQAVGQEESASRAAQEAAKHRLHEADTAVRFAQDQARRLAEESRMGGIAAVDALQAQAEASKLLAARDALAADTRRQLLDTTSRIQQQQAQIEALRGQIQKLQGEWTQTGMSTTRLQQDAERRVIRAPVSGTVGKLISLRAGAYVAEGQTLATIVPHGGLMVVADFAPSALGRIQPGQSARLRLDAYPWAQFGSISATVARVASDLQDQHLRVEFTPLPSQAQGASRMHLQHGLPGQVDVALETVSPALLVLRAVGQVGLP